MITYYINNTICCFRLCRKLAFLLLVLTFFIAGTATGKERYSVLFISSYHPGFPTFFQQVDGLKSIFNKSEVDFDIEFMDTKRFPDKLNRDNFERLLTCKLQQRKPYDVVVVADDNAFQFALDQQDNLFSGLPIVFFGVNNVDLAVQQNSNPKITGVVEAVSMNETIELMIRLRPDTANVIALVDDTPSGQGDLKSFYQAAQKITSHTFSDISVSDTTWGDFFNVLGSIDKNSAVLLLSAYRDKTDSTVLFEESLAGINEKLLPPLFHLWYHGIGEGILGGKVINHFEQGKTAAEIVLRILDGYPVDTINVVEKSPNQFVFDHNQLVKYGIPESSLPEKSLILNKPYSLYTEHKKLIWFLTSVFSILVMALFFAILNIVLRKRVETELRLSEVKHKEMIANISDVIAILNPEGTVMYKSPNIERLFGWGQDELVGKDGLTTAHPDDLERIQNGFIQLVKKDRAVTKVEYRYLCKDGSYKWVELKAVNLISDPLINGILLNYCDITERKIAERNLIAEMDKLEIVTQNAGVGLAVISTEYETIWANKVIYDIFGDVIGKSCHVVYNQNDDICENCGVREILAKDREFVSFEQKGKDADGNTIWSEIIATPIKDEDGNVTSVLEVVLPVTERKQLEDQLRQSQKMESIVTITGGVAHDFNNILGIIIGNTELALDDVPEWNPAYGNLREIKAAGLRASGIVKQLLNFSRRTDHKLDSIDIIPVIKKSLALLRPTIPATIDIQEELPDTALTVFADPDQINQILSNLYLNATQAMEDTGGLLQVTVDTVVADETAVFKSSDLKAGETYIKIVVADTGPGITPEIADRIFDPYFTTRDVGKGSGMGLAIVHGLVNNHKGHVTVDSKPGKGSVFTILLPLTGQTVTGETRVKEMSSPRAERILFVDDEEPITIMIETVLTRMGYQVQATTNPAEALELFKLNPGGFDLVITDMTMPQMTGVQLSERLIDIRKDIPVIICTGHSSTIDIEKTKDLGVSAHITKPVAQQELAEVIRRVLDK